MVGLLSLANSVLIVRWDAEDDVTALTTDMRCRRRVRMSAAALALALSTPAAAAPTIADASWLAGRWVGEGLGGIAEESWAPAAGGQMVGHFQLVKDGKPQFYEILLLDEKAPGLRLRVKHFNPDFTAWEDKGEWHSFEPVSVEPNVLRFNGLTFERNGDDLLITVALRQKDGTVANHSIRLKRAPL